MFPTEPANRRKNLTVLPESINQASELLVGKEVFVFKTKAPHLNWRGRVVGLDRAEFPCHWYCLIGDKGERFPIDDSVEVSIIS